MERITITDGCGLSATVIPERGATAVSLVKDGVEFLYCNEENLNSAERPRCGIPFLFPIFGRLKEAHYELEGKTYDMEIHGFGHTSAWQVVSRSSDELILALDASAQTLGQYPFRFRVTLRFRAENGGLTIAQCYENMDVKPMPFNYGFHPYFRVEQLEKATVEADAQAQVDFTKGAAIPFGHGEIRVTIPEGAPESGAALAGVRSPAILHLPEEGRELVLEFDSSFTQMVLWTMAGKPFLCVEPVNGMPNSLVSETGLVLESGQKYEAVFKIFPKVI